MRNSTNMEFSNKDFITWMLSIKSSRRAYLLKDIGDNLEIKGLSNEQIVNLFRQLHTQPEVTSRRLPTDRDNALHQRNKSKSLSKLKNKNILENEDTAVEDNNSFCPIITSVISLQSEEEFESLQSGDRTNHAPLITEDECMLQDTVSKLGNSINTNDSTSSDLDNFEGHNERVNLENPSEEDQSLTNIKLPTDSCKDIMPIVSDCIQEIQSMSCTNEKSDTLPDKEINRTNEVKKKTKPQPYTVQSQNNRITEREPSENDKIIKLLENTKLKLVTKMINGPNKYLEETIKQNLSSTVPSLKCTGENVLNVDGLNKTSLLHSSTCRDEQLNIEVNGNPTKIGQHFNQIGNTVTTQILSINKEEIEQSSKSRKSIKINNASLGENDTTKGISSLDELPEKALINRESVVEPNSTMSKVQTKKLTIETVNNLEQTIPEQSQISEKTTTNFIDKSNDLTDVNNIEDIPTTSSNQQMTNEQPENILNNDNIVNVVTGCSKIVEKLSHIADKPTRKKEMNQKSSKSKKIKINNASLDQNDIMEGISSLDELPAKDITNRKRLSEPNSTMSKIKTKKLTIETVNNIEQTIPEQSQISEKTTGNFIDLSNDSMDVNIIEDVPTSSSNQQMTNEQPENILNNDNIVNVVTGCSKIVEKLSHIADKPTRKKEMNQKSSKSKNIKINNASLDQNDIMEGISSLDELPAKDLTNRKRLAEPNSTMSKVKTKKLTIETVNNLEQTIAEQSQISEKTTGNFIDLSNDSMDVNIIEDVPTSSSNQQMTNEQPENILNNDNIVNVVAGCSKIVEKLSHIADKPTRKKEMNQKSSKSKKININNASLDQNDIMEGISSLDELPAKDLTNRKRLSEPNSTMSKVKTKKLTIETVNNLEQTIPEQSQISEKTTGHFIDLSNDSMDVNIIEDVPTSSNIQQITNEQPDHILNNNNVVHRVTGCREVVEKLPQNGNNIEKIKQVYEHVISDSTVSSSSMIEKPLELSCSERNKQSSVESVTLANEPSFMFSLVESGQELTVEETENHTSIKCTNEERQSSCVMKPFRDKLIDDSVELYLKYFNNSSQALDSVPKEFQNTVQNYLIFKGKVIQGITVPVVVKSYLLLYTKYFVEINNNAINKTAEILHLAIADFNRREERTKLALRLNSNVLREAELKGASKDYNDSLNVRCKIFSETYQSVLKTFENSFIFILSVTFYYKIIQALLLIDTENIKHFFLVKQLMISLLSKSSVEQSSYSFLNMMDSELERNYTFIKMCLLPFYLTRYLQSDSQSKDANDFRFALFWPSSVQLNNMVSDITAQYKSVSGDMFSLHSSYIKPSDQHLSPRLQGQTSDQHLIMSREFEPEFSNVVNYKARPVGKVTSNMNKSSSTQIPLDNNFDQHKNTQRTLNTVHSRESSVNNFNPGIIANTGTCTYKPHSTHYGNIYRNKNAPLRKMAGSDLVTTAETHCDTNLLNGGTFIAIEGGSVTTNQHEIGHNQGVGLASTSYQNSAHNQEYLQFIPRRPTLSSSSDKNLMYVPQQQHNTQQHNTPLQSPYPKNYIQIQNQNQQIGQHQSTQINLNHQIGPKINIGPSQQHIQQTTGQNQVTQASNRYVIAQTKETNILFNSLIRNQHNQIQQQTLSGETYFSTQQQKDTQSYRQNQIILGEQNCLQVPMLRHLMQQPIRPPNQVTAEISANQQQTISSQRQTFPVQTNIHQSLCQPSTQVSPQSLVTTQPSLPRSVNSVNYRMSLHQSGMSRPNHSAVVKQVQMANQMASTASGSVLSPQHVWCSQTEEAEQRSQHQCDTQEQQGNNGNYLRKRERELDDVEDNDPEYFRSCDSKYKVHQEVYHIVERFQSGTCAMDGCERPSTVACSLCKAIFYCTIDCQKSHWYSNHSTECPINVNPMV